MSKVLKIRKIFLQSSEVVISDPVSSTGYEDYSVETEFNCNSQYQEVIHKDETSYIVSLDFNIYNKIDNDPLYNFNFIYSGLFTPKNYTAEDLELVLAIECPEIILPYARLHATTVTTQTGLAPVMIQNINFEELYEEQKNMELDLQ